MTANAQIVNLIVYRLKPNSLCPRDNLSLSVGPC